MNSKLNKGNGGTMELLLKYAIYFTVVFIIYRLIVKPLVRRISASLSLYVLLKSIRINDNERNIIFLAITLSKHEQINKFVDWITSTEYNDLFKLIKETQWLMTHLNNYGYKEGVILKTLLYRLRQHSEYGFDVLPEQVYDERIDEISNRINDYSNSILSCSNGTQIDFIAVLSLPKLVQYLKA